MFTLLKTWGGSVTGSDKIPLSEYTGTIPFATIKDFAGEGFSGYTYTMTGMLRGINVIEEKNDIIAPKCIEYNEYAQVSRADGSLMDCCLYVDYCELLNPFMAKICAKELYRLDKVRKHASKTKAPELPADYVIAYTDNSHFPMAICSYTACSVKYKHCCRCHFVFCAYA